MGAHQEGAGASPPQPQKKENHLQLYYWLVSLLSLVHWLSDCVAAESTASVWADGSVSERERARGGQTAELRGSSRMLAAAIRAAWTLELFVPTVFFLLKSLLCGHRRVHSRLHCVFWWVVLWWGSFQSQNTESWVNIIIIVIITTGHCWGKKHTDRTVVHHHQVHFIISGNLRTVVTLTLTYQ